MPNQKPWSLDAARRLYSIQHWGDGYFDINAAGNVAMHLPKQTGQIDLYELAQRVHHEQGMRFPLLVRFVDILHDRVQRLQIAFNKAISDAGQHSRYTAIYPIKVNQQRSVVEEILNGGRYSIFAPNAVAGAEFSPGGWSAEFGGRNGSLLQFEVEDGAPSPVGSLRLDLAGVELLY